MGPEALMVQSRASPRWDLADYARLEYPCEDIRVVAACIANGVAERPARAPPTGGWVSRARVWVRARAARGAAEPAPRSEPTPLAALPATRAGAPPAAEAGPVWAIPMLARDVPDRA